MGRLDPDRGAADLPVVAAEGRIRRPVRRMEHRVTVEPDGREHVGGDRLGELAFDEATRARMNQR